VKSVPKLRPLKYSQINFIDVMQNVEKIKKSQRPIEVKIEKSRKMPKIAKLMSQNS